MNTNNRKPPDSDNTLANENQNIQNIQEELKEQSEFLHTIFASIKHPFCVIDVKDYTVKLANPAALRGGIPEELKCYQLTHKRETPCSNDHTCPLKQVVRTGKPFIVEHMLYDRGGKPMYVEIHGYPIFDNDGRVIQMIEYSLDITKRKKAEIRLRTDEERLETILKLTQMEFDTEKELTEYALEEAVKLTGSTVGYFHFFNEDGKTLQLYLWSQDVLKHCTAEKTPHYPLENAGIWADCVRLKKPVVHNDYQNYPEKKGLPEGHFPVLRHMSVPVFDGNTIVAVIGVGNKEEPYEKSDTRQLNLYINSLWKIIKHKRAETALKRSEEALRESEETFRTISASAQDAIIMIDNHGAISYWNVAATRILGYSLEDALGKNVHSLLAPERFHTDYHRGFAGFQKTGGGSVVGKTVELAARRKNSTEIPIELSVSAVKLRGKWNAIGIMRDITERKLAEIQLQEHVKELEETRWLKKRYLSFIVHELKRPLHAVYSAASVLARRELHNDEDATMLEIITRNLTSMKDMVEYVLMLEQSKLIGKVTEFAEFEVKPLIVNLMKDLEVQVCSKELRFVADIEDGLIVTADREKLNYIFSNLISNAIKFTESGSITVSGCREADMVNFSVTDTGRGITGDLLKEVEQVLADTDIHSLRRDGSGIGLSVVNNFVRLHGGTVWFETDQHTGTAFHFTIPLRYILVEQQGDSAMMYYTGGQATSHGRELHNQVIDLLADGCLHITIDIANIHYMSSHDVSVFSVILRDIQANSGTMILSNVSWQVQELMKMTSLDQMITIIPAPPEEEET